MNRLSGGKQKDAGLKARRYTKSGGPITGTSPVLVPEIQNPQDHGAEIWVFELPEKNGE